jgi:translocation and assembly module TamB
MTLFGKSIKKRWLALAALPFLAALGLLALLQSEQWNQYLKTEAIRAVNAATGGKLTLQKLQTHWLQGNFAAEGVVFRGTEAPSEAPLFSAKRIQIGIHIWTLLRKQLDLRELLIDEPKIHLRLAADGSSNLPVPPATQSNKNPIETLLDLKLGHWQATRGEFQINQTRQPWEANIRQLEAKMDYLAVSRSYRGSLAAQDIQTQWSQAPGKKFSNSSQVKLAFRLDRERMEIDQLEWASGPATRLSAKGRLDRWTSPRAELDVDAQLAVDLVHDLLQLPIDKRGEAYFKGVLLYDADRGLELHGDARAEQLIYRDESTKVGPLSARGRLDLVPSSITLTQLRAQGLGGVLTGGFGWKQQEGWRFDGDLAGLPLASVFDQLQTKGAGWSGTIAGPVRASGGKAPLDIETELKIAAQDGALPLEGLLSLHYDGANGNLEARDSYLRLPDTRLNFAGNLAQGLRLQFHSNQLNDLLPAWKLLRPDQPFPPLTLQQGNLNLNGTLRGSLSAPLFRGKLDAANLKWQEHPVDHLSTSIDWGAELLTLNTLEARRKDLSLNGEIRAALEDGQLRPQSLLSGSLKVNAEEFSGLLKEFGLTLPLSGDAEIRMALRGTLDSPAADGALRARRLHWEKEILERVNVVFQAGRRDVSVPEWQATLDGRLLQGKFQLKAGGDDWKLGEGSASFKTDALPLGAFERFKSLGTRASASLSTDLQLGLSWSPEAVSFSRLDGRLLLGNITQFGRPLGQLEFTVRTAGRRASLTAQGTLRQLPVKGDATIQLGPKLDTELRLQLPRLDFPVIAQMFSEEILPSPLPYEGSAEASIFFQGPLLDSTRWNGTLTIPQLQLAPNKAYVNDTLPAVADVVLRNEGPLVFTYKEGQIAAANLRLVAKDTNITTSFSYALADGRLSGRALGRINLAVLSTLKPDLLASGVASLDTTLRGTAQEPDLNGKLEFKNASFYLRDVLTGFEKVNGTLLFDRNRATIDSFQAQAGGGQLQLSGFVGFGKTLTYRLQAQATQVRIRYPEGVSTSANAQLALTGTTAQSILTGTVTILRTNVGQIDTATLSSSAKLPGESAEVRNEFLRNLQFDVRVDSAPNAEFSTTLTKDVRGEIALRLRGSPQRPVLLGRVAATQGEIDFFGSRYDINRAEVLFNNPLRLDPTVNLDLETRVRGVTISMNFSGPATKLNMTYRSDPPLQSSEILALLTVGRNPGSTSSVLPAGLNQSGGQTQGISGNDSSVVLGAAVSAGINGRLQRFFGISRVRLDPQLTGIDNVPQARLTLEQQVSRDVTLTYITNLNRTQQQIVRIDWDISRQWSVVAVRDENGVFGLDLFYRKRFK